MSFLFQPSLQDQVPGDATVGDVPANGLTQGPGATDGPGAAPPGWSLFGGSLMPLLLVVVIFWVLVIMPQGKERKKRAKMLEALAKDDQVMTNGGLYGRVAKVDGDVVTPARGRRRAPAVPQAGHPDRARRRAYELRGPDRGRPHLTRRAAPTAAERGGGGSAERGAGGVTEPHIARPRSLAAASGAER